MISDSWCVLIVGKKGNTNVTGANASIAMIFLFGIVYSFTYTPLQALYCAEYVSFLFFFFTTLIIFPVIE